ncbi:MAG: hypothetical protein R3248_03370 [Candidatus Promineifilaceae bacterium]|nr:hypothetical protein [Candidatus Promineifilaceae bacterium]
MSLIQAVVGFVSLFFGRLLFWLFVGAAGFVVGFELALAFLGDQAIWLVLLVALIAGVLGSIVATFAQRLAVAIAGFVAGGYFLLNLVRMLGTAGGPPNTVSVVLYVTGGLIGAVLVSLLFDPSLIVLSSALGATLLTQAAGNWLDLGRVAGIAVFVLLFVAGVFVQWGAQGRRRERREGQVREEGAPYER